MVVARLPDFERESDTAEHPIALPRVATQDLTVHVYVEGAYHRRHPSLYKTSCDIAFPAPFCPTRREEIRHPLSRACGCFTQAELAEADATSEREQGESL